MSIEINLHKNKPFMLVDDDNQFHILFNYAYKRSGLTNPLIDCNSGQECLQFLDEVDPESLSLILMDVNMPGMNGIETVRSIRRSKRFGHTPIIVMLTCSDYQPDIDTAIAAGADSYFTKPHNLSDFQFSNIL